MYPVSTLFGEKTMESDRYDSIQGRTTHGRRIALQFCYAQNEIRINCHYENNKPEGILKLENMFEYF
jgi:hypothetical protein